jgi:hypothetical protein
VAASQTTAPIPLRAERRRRLLMTVLVIVTVILVSFAVVSFAGQAFGPDPMTGT